MDLLQQGQEWLANQLKQHASRAVIYQRGAEQVAVQATIGRTLLKLDDGYGGTYLEWTDRDFLIQAEDLVFNSLRIIPTAGDRVLEANGVVTSIYEVMVYGNEPAWRASDPFGKLLRIHTKYCGVL